MENDTIRSSGETTLVDIWLDGQMRRICVSRPAIETYLMLSPERASGMSDEDRCEFVRANLSLIMKAARRRLGDMAPAADTITLEAGELAAPPAKGADRRKTERRKSDRRKSESAGIPAALDRRKGDRRKGNRRGTRSAPADC